MAGDASVLGQELMDELATYPALAEARDGLQAVARDGADSTALVEAIEADPALTMATLRLANRGARSRSVSSVAQAVETLSPATLAAVAESTPVLDRLSPDRRWGLLPDRFRVHSVRVSRILQRVLGLVGGGVVAIMGGDAEDALITAAVLHDIGTLALHARGQAAPFAVADSQTPEARVAEERETAGTDHAELGGRVAAEWGLSDELEQLIRQHHDATEGEAGLLRLADNLARYSIGRTVDVPVLVTLAERLELSRDALSQLLYELPHAITTQPRSPEPSPLSERELEVLSRLGDAMAPKAIAIDLGLAESTVRNHLHRIYSRLGVADRAQAVILAREKGWI